MTQRLPPFLDANLSPTMAHLGNNDRQRLPIPNFNPLRTPPPRTKAPSARGVTFDIIEVFENPNQGFPFASPSAAQRRHQSSSQREPQAQQQTDKRGMPLENMSPTMENLGNNDRQRLPIPNSNPLPTPPPRTKAPSEHGATVDIDEVFQNTSQGRTAKGGYPTAQGGITNVYQSQTPQQTRPSGMHRAQTQPLIGANIGIGNSFGTANGQYLQGNRSTPAGLGMGNLTQSSQTPQTPTGARNLGNTGGSSNAGANGRPRSSSRSRTHGSPRKSRCCHCPGLLFLFAT